MTKRKTIKITITKEMLDEAYQKVCDAVLYGYKNPELERYRSGRKPEEELEAHKRLTWLWRKDDETYMGKES